MRARYAHASAMCKVRNFFWIFGLPFHFLANQKEESSRFQPYGLSSYSNKLSANTVKRSFGAIASRPVWRCITSAFSQHRQKKFRGDRLASGMALYHFSFQPTPSKEVSWRSPRARYGVVSQRPPTRPISPSAIIHKKSVASESCSEATLFMLIIEENLFHAVAIVAPLIE